MKRILALLLCLLMLLPLVAACGDDPAETTTGTTAGSEPGTVPTNPPVTSEEDPDFEEPGIQAEKPVRDVTYETLSMDALSGYSVVYMFGATHTMENTAKDFQKALNTYGLSMSLKTDVIADTTGRELVLATLSEYPDRSDVAELIQEGIRRDDYRIVRTETGRVVLLGGSAEALNAAIAKFYTMLDARHATINMPQNDGFFYDGDYPVGVLTLNGADIHQYKIAVGIKYTAQTNYMNRLLSEATGYSLGITKDADHKIIIGESVTPISDGEYVFECVDGVIYVNGSGKVGMNTAMRYFVNYLTGYNGVYTNTPYELLNIKIEGTHKITDAEISALKPTKIYVSTKGDAENTGAFSSPVDSIYTAQNKARLALKSSLAPVNVLFRGGDYVLDRTVKFTLSDSGTATTPVTYCNYNNELVRFLGGIRISPEDVVDAPDDISTTLISEDELYEDGERNPAMDNLKMIDLSEYVDAFTRIRSQQDSTYFPMEVYVNGIALEYARWPNNETSNLTGCTVTNFARHEYNREGKVYHDGYLRHISSVREFSQTVGGKTVYYLGYRKNLLPAFYNVPSSADSVDLAGDYVYYSSEDAKIYSNTYINEVGIDDLAWERFSFWSEETKQDLWIFAYAQQQWRDESYRVIGSAEDPTSGEKFLYTNGYGVYSFETGSHNKRYFFYNVLEEIDLPGECYVDHENLRIYFYNGSREEFDVASSNFYVSTLTDTMLKLSGTSYMNFRGLEFCTSRGMGIYMANATNIKVDACNMYGLSSNAMSLQSSSNITVTNCDIYNTCRGGINIEYCGHRQTLTPANILIENNYFSETARLKRTYTGSIILKNSVGVTVRHNEITNCPHEVIGIGNSNNMIIEYNIISNAVYDCDDAAAIYWGRDPSSLGYVIRYNYFKNVGNKYSSGHANSIYCDDWGTGAEIYGNIFYRAGTPNNQTSGAAIYGRANFEQIYNNIFVDNFNSAYISWPTSMPHQFKRVITSRYGSSRRESGVLADTLMSDDISANFYLEIANAGYSNANWYYILVDAGFFTDTWKEYYKDTIWGVMWDFYNDENFDHVDDIVLRHIFGDNYAAEGHTAQEVNAANLKAPSYGTRSLDVSQQVPAYLEIFEELDQWCIETATVTNDFYGNVNVSSCPQFFTTPGTTYSAHRYLKDGKRVKYTGAVMYHDRTTVNGNTNTWDNITLDTSYFIDGEGDFTAADPNAIELAEQMFARYEYIDYLAEDFDPADVDFDLTLTEEGLDYILANIPDDSVAIDFGIVAGLVDFGGTSEHAGIMGRTHVNH